MAGSHWLHLWRAAWIRDQRSTGMEVAFQMRGEWGMKEGRGSRSEETAETASCDRDVTGRQTEQGKEVSAATF